MTLVVLIVRSAIFGSVLSAVRRQTTSPPDNMAEITQEKHVAVATPLSSAPTTSSHLGEASGTPSRGGLFGSVFGERRAEDSRAREPHPPSSPALPPASPSEEQSPAPSTPTSPAPLGKASAEMMGLVPHSAPQPDTATLWTEHEEEITQAVATM